MKNGERHDKKLEKKDRNEEGRGHRRVSLCQFSKAASSLVDTSVTERGTAAFFFTAF